MTDEPLIYTKNGNVPIASLRYEHKWVDGPEVLMFEEAWFDKTTGELVKNNAHGYAKNGISISGEQVRM